MASSHRACTAVSALLLPGISEMEKEFSSQHRRSLPWFILLQL